MLHALQNATESHSAEHATHTFLQVAFPSMCDHVSHPYTVTSAAVIFRLNRPFRAFYMSLELGASLGCTPVRRSIDVYRTVNISNVRYSTRGGPPA